MTRTKRDPRLDLPPLELECLRALWSLGEATVHAIRVSLLPGRPLAYTTVMTVMDRLARKGAVERGKRSRAYLYRPLVSLDQMRRQALERFLEEHFGGSAENLQAFLGGKPTASLRGPQEPIPQGPRTQPARTDSDSRRSTETELDAALL